MTHLILIVNFLSLAGGKETVQFSSLFSVEGMQERDHEGVRGALCNPDWRLYLKRQPNWLITASYKRLEQRLVKCNEEQG